MPAPRKSAPRAPISDDSSESIADWFVLHQKAVLIGVIVLAAALGGAWFYQRSQQLRSERAERAYYAAQRSVMAGNLPLAETDLRRLIVRYDGTAAAHQARLVLGQILFEQAKYQEGIDELRNDAGLLSSKDFGSSAHLLLAAGYEQLGKHSEAGAEYEAAARAARFDADRQRNLAFAARAYRDGGRLDDARRLWTELGADSKGVVAGEARVRLGELVAAPAVPGAE